MTTYEAFGSGAVAGPVEDTVAGWFELARLHVVPVLAEMELSGTPTGGLVHDPAKGVYDLQYVGTRPPMPPSFLPETHLTLSHYGPGTTPQVMCAAAVSDDGETLDLACQVFGVLDPALGDVVAEGLAVVLGQQADRHVLDFGNVAGDNYTYGTSLEVGLRRTREEGRREARRVLRGYSWVTLVPEPLVPQVAGRLGEDPGLKVRTSATGSAVVQAGPRFSDWDDEMAARLFRGLAPILPTGVPRKPRRFGSSAPVHLVQQDPRQVD